MIKTKKTVNIELDVEELFASSDIKVRDLYDRVVGGDNGKNSGDLVVSWHRKFINELDSNNIDGFKESDKIGTSVFRLIVEEIKTMLAEG